MTKHSGHLTIRLIIQHALPLQWCHIFCTWKTYCSGCAVDLTCGYPNDNWIVCEVKLLYMWTNHEDTGEHCWALFGMVVRWLGLNLKHKFTEFEHLLAPRGRNIWLMLHRPTELLVGIELKDPFFVKTGDPGPMSWWPWTHGDPGPMVTLDPWWAWIHGDPGPMVTLDPWWPWLDPWWPWLDPWWSWLDPWWPSWLDPWWPWLDTWWSWLDPWWSWLDPWWTYLCLICHPLYTAVHWRQPIQRVPHLCPSRICEKPASSTSLRKMYTEVQKGGTSFTSRSHSTETVPSPCNVTMPVFK